MAEVVGLASGPAEECELVAQKTAAQATIDHLDPSSGPAGTRVTVFGSDLQDTRYVEFDGVQTNAQNATMSSVTCTAPNHSDGTVDVYCVNTAGIRSTNHGSFVYMK
jgi:hypothetical protein